jgi:large subunit ribosomal protein L17
MRHGNKINHLGRKKAHRDALLKNLSNALIRYKRINTTLAKAKELRKHIEPLLTKCKTDSTHNRRILFSYLQDKESIKELFGTISDKISSRPGGYTRIIKLGFRSSDAAEMAMIELVDFNEIYKTESSSAAGKTRRSRKKASTAPVVNAVEEAPVVEEVVEEVAVEETANIEETTVEEIAVEETASIEETTVEEIAVEETANIEETTVEDVVEESTIVEEENSTEEPSEEKKED